MKMNDESPDVTDWRDEIPEISGLPPEVCTVLDARARRSRYDQGARLFHSARPPQGLIVPVSGTIRVQRQAAPGQVKTCLIARADDADRRLETALALSIQPRTAEAIAEDVVEVIDVPRDAFDTLMNISKEFRALVYKACSKRISDLFVVIEETAASRIEIQLAAELIEPSGQSAPGQTPQRLSIALGAPQVVVLEYLREFERRGWITAECGGLALRDVPAIRELAHGG
jgi:CRP/FNR family transcriptional regulator